MDALFFIDITHITAYNRYVTTLSHEVFHAKQNIYEFTIG